MPLDATLLDLLACPSDDHAPLLEQTRRGADVLVCSFCASVYPIEDGIPVLLLDEATPGPNGIGSAAPPKDAAPPKAAPPKAAPPKAAPPKAAPQRDVSQRDVSQ